jgi:hypothetical protein
MKMYRVDILTQTNQNIPEEVESGSPRKQGQLSPETNLFLQFHFLSAQYF